MSQEPLDITTDKHNRTDKFIILYTSLILLFGGISYHIYLIYSMRQQAMEFAEHFNTQGFYFLQYNISFIPLYVISVITGAIVLWWGSRKKLQTATNLIGVIILILTFAICFIPTDKWFG